MAALRRSGPYGGLPQSAYAGLAAESQRSELVLDSRGLSVVGAGCTRSSSR
jgi:hypothetical protein